MEGGAGQWWYGRDAVVQVVPPLLEVVSSPASAGFFSPILWPRLDQCFLTLVTSVSILWSWVDQCFPGQIRHRVGFAPFAPFATLAPFALFAPPLDTGESVQVHLPYCLIGIEQEEPLDQTPTPLGFHPATTGCSANGV